MGDMSEPGQPAVTRSSKAAEFEEFVDASSARLFSMAMLLTGRHRPEAEDLLQTVLERAYRHWRRICQNGDPEPYVRQMLANASIDRWRRLRRRPEEPLPADPGALWPAGRAAARDDAADLAERDLLLRALAELPAGQRAVLVLRYFGDMSEIETARALGCSVGAVKSQASRGLARLRRQAAPAAPAAPVAAVDAPRAAVAGPTGGARHV
jgi:RNA polymerase sigma-70 factor (sigma-E family)